MQNYVKSRDYAIRIKRTKSHKKFVFKQSDYLYVMCNKEDKIIESKITKRVREASRMIECFFNILTKKNDEWFVIHNDITHNHESNIIKTHSKQRKLIMTFAIKDKIKKSLRVNIKSRQTLNEFRKKNSNCILLLKDIYNVKHVFRVEILKNLTFTQALIMILRKRERWFHVVEKKFISKKITWLFFVDLMSTKKFLKINYEILIMNCIYKINKYKILLLDIIDHTCLKTTFYAVLCFLFEKIEKNYVWVIKKNMKFLFRLFEIFNFDVFVIDHETTFINVLEVSYSRVNIFLCLWHINKNIKNHVIKLMTIKKNCDQFLKNWNVVVYSHTIAKYNENYVVFEIKYIFDVDFEKNSKFSSKYFDEEKIDATKQIKNDLK